MSLEWTWVVVLLGPVTWVFPCPATLPMGFSWSVYLCQCAEEALFKRATRLEKCPLVNDRDGPPIFTQCQTRECEDCLGFVHADKHWSVKHVAREGRRSHGELTTTFDGAGLLTHSVSVSDSQVISPWDSFGL